MPANGRFKHGFAGYQVCVPNCCRKSEASGSSPKIGICVIELSAEEMTSLHMGRERQNQVKISKLNSDAAGPTHNPDRRAGNSFAPVMDSTAVSGAPKAWREQSVFADNSFR